MALLEFTEANFSYDVDTDTVSVGTRESIWINPDQVQLVRDAQPRLIGGKFTRGKVVLVRMLDGEEFEIFGAPGSIATQIGLATRGV